MANKNQQLNKLVEYYSKPLSKDRIVYLNTLNAVEPEKVELYRDFILSLTILIGDTYLGEDAISEEEQYKSHFNWCWKKTIESFEKECLYFDQMGEHYYYFYKYFYDMFYSREDKPKNCISRFINFWEELMAIDRLKTHADYDLFINLYKIQTKHFKNNFA